MVEGIRLDVLWCLDAAAVGFTCAVDILLRAMEHCEVNPADQSPEEVDVGHVAVMVANGEGRLADTIKEVDDGGNDEGLAENTWREEKGNDTGG